MQIFHNLQAKQEKKCNTQPIGYLIIHKIILETCLVRYSVCFFFFGGELFFIFLLLIYFMNELEEQTIKWYFVE